MQMAFLHSHAWLRSSATFISVDFSSRIRGLSEESGQVLLVGVRISFQGICCEW
jgi:hypothetical protein